MTQWNDESNDDFIYVGNNLLTKHILFNLIKNSLKATKESERGKIYISLKKGKKYNSLIFKDTANGFSSRVFKALFQKFNSDSQDGAGLGLSFCEMTMKSYGGDIACDSKKGKYTEFVLSFPVV